MTKFFVFITTVFLLSQQASAAAFNGNYTVEKDCKIEGSQLAALIPTGTIQVTEHIPVNGQESILFQSNGATNPVLTLGVGEQEGDFRWGPIPFSVGTYRKDGSFLVNYFLPKQNGGVELVQTIRILNDIAGLTLIATGSDVNTSAVCFFRAKK